jgi:hypothetical protein
MWIVAIAWMYVAVMMAVAEASSPQGSVLGAVITLLFYGVAPVALVMYLLSTPARRRALREAEARADANQAAEASQSAQIGPQTASTEMTPNMQEPTQAPGQVTEAQVDSVSAHQPR